MAKRILKLVGLLVAAWCFMTFVHELGHVVCGIVGGGTLVSAELRPWHLPHSFFQPNPYPLITLWGGPLIGVVVPMGLAVVIQTNWMWFIAHFCLLANGLYVALAWVSGDPFLDTPQLLRQGAHPSLIIFYCLITIGFGYVGFRKRCERVLTPDSKKA